MNKIKLILTVIITALIAVSCDTDYNEFESDPSSGWVYFSRIETSIPFSQTSSIPVTLQASTNTEGLDITYNVIADEADSSVPSQVLGTYTQENAIAANELNGTINVNLSQVDEASTCYEVTIELVSTSRSSVTTGLEGDEENEVNYPTMHQLSVGRFPSEFVGTTSFRGTPVLNFTPELIPVEGQENSYSIASAWGDGLLPTLNPDLDNLLYPAIITINNDGTVDVESNQTYATGGTGEYNACDQSISYTLSQSYLSDDTITFDVVLTAAQ